MNQKIHRGFSTFFFLWTNLLTLAVLGLFFSVFFPSFWQSQLQYSISTFILTFVITHLLFAFIEFFFHRYILHTATFGFFEHFYQKHTNHHSHTAVTAVQNKYHNYYPILEEHQLENSFFPWYSFILFAIAFIPVLIGLSILTSMPFLSSGLVALLFSISLYEFLHLLFHKPLTWWSQFLEHPLLGSLTKRMYAFHLDHHLNVGCNESVAGFFGFPVADIMFGTYQYNQNLYPHKHSFTETPQTNRPGLLIRFLDSLFFKSK